MINVPVGSGSKVLAKNKSVFCCQTCIFWPKNICQLENLVPLINRPGKVDKEELKLPQEFETSSLSLLVPNAPKYGFDRRRDLSFQKHFRNLNLKIKIDSTRLGVFACSGLGTWIIISFTMSIWFSGFSQTILTRQPRSIFSFRVILLRSSLWKDLSLAGK